MIVCGASAGVEGIRLLDVVVVGGGPVGSYVAAGLARAGLTVTVVEEHSQVGFPARCTGLIGEEAFRRFPLPEGVTLRTVSSATIYGPGGAKLSYEHEAGFARVVDRPRLDAGLGDAAVRSGARLRTGVRVDKVTIERTHAAVVTSRGDVLRARSVVLATGLLSRLPQQLGFGKIPNVIYGVQVETEIDGGAYADVAGVEVYVGRDLTPGSFGWVVPTLAGRARVGLTAYDRPLERLARLLDDPRLRSRGFRAIGKAVVAPLPLGGLPFTVADRIVVVGEAAGQVKTTTGGGVYYGLLAAEIAVEVLVRALAEDNLSRQSLAEYDRRWRAALEREIEAGLCLRKIARRVDDSTLALLIELANRDGVKRAICSHGFFDWHAPLISALFDGPLAVLGAARLQLSARSRQFGQGLG
jgi:geranylgeranyl reductase family protein